MASSFGWDLGAVYSTAVDSASASGATTSATALGGDLLGLGADANGAPDAPATLLAYQRRFFDFLQDFNQHGVFIYRDVLHQALMMRRYSIAVSFRHLYAFNSALATMLKKSPADLLPLFELAAQQRARRVLSLSENEKAPEIQVTIQPSDEPMSIRNLNASNIGKLIEISGIVIGASTVSAKATSLHLMCRSCRHITSMPISSGFTGAQLPRACTGPPTPGVPKECPLDPYVIVHDKCAFVDQQSIKLQEAPDLVPVGELPRHIVLSADRFLTNKLLPGTRATIVGIYSVINHSSGGGGGGGGGGKGPNAAQGVAIRTPYVRVVGIDVHQDHANRKNATFTAEEEELFLSYSRRPNFVTEFARSIAPSIYGHDDVKKAVACLLFGGTRKALPDGMRLRGDINVLLLGDPGVAKSQLLKFVERVAPVSVYTSGKGSSAAGLTASVIRDPGSRDFYLEGGAMVLADGGVVCIDEFDKMRDDDRVAIHEAMEQQTISIAKAGITTMLNSRTSVLAAANPLFGRYDDLKTPGENIDFQSTILSRFDMIFLLRDTHNEASDERIARHVMNIHKLRPSEAAGGPAGNTPDFDMQTMKRYITYARSRCAPRLSEEAQIKLSSYFVQIRGEVRSLEMRTGSRAPVPITVRQLEAVIRISEALAKMTLCAAVSEAHVDEAMRLFHCSTMTALEAGSMVDSLTITNMRAEVQIIESDLVRRLALGASASVAALTREFVGRGLSEGALTRALRILVDRGTLQLRHQRKTVFRVGA